MADYDLLDDYYFPLSDEDFENRYTHTTQCIHPPVYFRAVNGAVLQRALFSSANVICVCVCVRVL